MINSHNTRYTTILSSWSNSRTKASFKRNAFKETKKINCIHLVNILDPVTKGNTSNQKKGEQIHRTKY